MTQLAFNFDLARTTDTQTSHDAAFDVSGKLTGYRAIFIERLHDLGAATSNEIAGGNESIRKRARECARLGLIVECGVRACSVTGKMATVWKVAK
jgi:hypothetical protein